MTIFPKNCLLSSIVLMLMTQASIAQWERTSGPRDLQISVNGSVFSDGGSLFAGMGTYGVYFSENKGTFWTPVNAAWPSGAFAACIAVSGNTIYVGTRNGVLRSAKNSSAWIPVNTGLPADPYIMFLKNSDTSLYAGID